MVFWGYLTVCLNARYNLAEHCCSRLWCTATQMLSGRRERRMADLSQSAHHRSPVLNTGSRTARRHFAKRRRRRSNDCTCCNDRTGADRRTAPGSKSQTLRLRSHRHESESKFPFTDRERPSLKYMQTRVSWNPCIRVLGLALVSLWTYPKSRSLELQLNNTRQPLGVGGWVDLWPVRVWAFQVQHVWHNVRHHWHSFYNWSLSLPLNWINLINAHYHLLAK